jgi:hypothetical protein
VRTVLSDSTSPYGVTSQKTVVILATERRGRVVNIPALYSGDHEFTSLPGDRLSSLRFFVVFVGPSRQIPGQYLEIRPRPSSFHVLSNSSFTHPRFDVSLRD